MSINLGYACINMALQKQKISCNKGMIKRTFKAKGVPYASELALKNVQALKKIIEWNGCLLYTSPSPRDVEESRMPSSA